MEINSSTLFLVYELTCFFVGNFYIIINFTRASQALHIISFQTIAFYKKFSAFALEAFPKTSLKSAY